MPPRREVLIEETLGLQPSFAIPEAGVCFKRIESPLRIFHNINPDQVGSNEAGTAKWATTKPERWGRYAAVAGQTDMNAGTPCLRRAAGRTAWDPAGRTAVPRVILAGPLSVRVRIALLSAFLAGDRAHAFANIVLTACQLALAGADRIHHVLPPDQRVRAAGDRCRGERGGPHQADRNRCGNHRGPGRAAPGKSAQSSGMRARAIGRAGGRRGRTEGNVTLTELTLQPEVEFVLHTVLT